MFSLRDLRVDQQDVAGLVRAARSGLGGDRRRIRQDFLIGRQLAGGQNEGFERMRIPAGNRLCPVGEGNLIEIEQHSLIAAVDDRKTPVRLIDHGPDVFAEFNQSIVSIAKSTPDSPGRIHA